MSVIGKTVILGGAAAIAIVARSALPLDGLTPMAKSEIPPAMVDVYKAAATRCIGLPWQALAAIGWVESRHAGGQIDPATGDVAAPIVGPALDGKDGSPRMEDRSQPDGFVHTLGPMGLLPAAWERYATLAPNRPAGATPSVHNAWDAAHTTANELCGESPVLDDLNRAIRTHTPRPTHVMEVLIKTARYGSGDSVPGVEALVAAVSGQGVGGRPSDGQGSSDFGPHPVVAAALKVLGTPYVWGAESPQTGFDCSGLVWWAYRQTGVSVPRTTAGQIHAGEPIPVGAQLRPGDLLFTRGGRPTHDLGHVAIYAGGGMEVIAPRSGKSVTVQRVDFDRVQAARRILTTE